MGEEADKRMIKRAICFGCSSQAGVLATVEDGKIVRLKGEPDHYMNRGWLCERESLKESIKISLKKNLTEES